MTRERTERVPVGAASIRNSTSGLEGVGGRHLCQAVETVALKRSDLYTITLTIKRHIGTPSDLSWPAVSLESTYRFRCMALSAALP